MTRVKNDVNNYGVLINTRAMIPTYRAPTHVEPVQGTLVQMEARGPQDAYLTQDPEVTYWSARKQTHANFATEVFDVDFDSFRFGSVATVTVPTKGEYIGDMFLELRLPRLASNGTWVYDTGKTKPGWGGTWVENIGYNILRKVRLTLGGLELHDQDRFAYNILDELFLSESKKEGLRRMISAPGTDKTHIVHVPLKFCCSKQHHDRTQYLPVTEAALELEIHTAPIDQCVIPPSWTASAMPSGITDLDPPLKCRLLYEVMFLDRQEAMRTRLDTHHILVPTVKTIVTRAYLEDEDVRIKSSEVKVPLNELPSTVDYIAFAAFDEASLSSVQQYTNSIDSVQFLMSSNVHTDTFKFQFYERVRCYANATRCTANNVGLWSFKPDAAVRAPSGSLRMLPTAMMNVTMKPNNSSTTAVSIVVLGFSTGVLEISKRGARFLHV